MDSPNKLWLQSSLNQVAAKRVSGAIRRLGKALPCRVVAVSGSIVTVAFEVQDAGMTLPNVTIPKLESQWIRCPTQVGDTGLTIPADVYLGGISGLGGGTANFSRRANLAALGWIPVASTGFSGVNIDAAFVSGPQGAVIQTQDGESKIVVNGSGITLTFGGKEVVLNGSGLTIDGILFDTHVHGGVENGGGETGGPQP